MLTLSLIYDQVLQVVSSLQVSLPRFCIIFHHSHACFMYWSPYPPPFDNPINTWHTVQIIKLVVMELFPLSRYVLIPESENSPKSPALRHP
jgi:hypothetical protein